MFGKWPAFDVTEQTPSSSTRISEKSLENGRLLMSRNISKSSETFCAAFGKWPAFDVTERQLVVVMPLGSVWKMAGF
ncbi:hypothetical protein MHK_009580 [Candidatus Magnetomorum sp. HK-1]|nr:hypothetical protein MHK_009580 [Candidatus Magnetomorum sp. HK-1]